MWIRTLALATAALFLALGVAGTMPSLANVLFGIAGLATLATLGLLVAQRRPRDPYDLNELHRVHEAEALREIDDEGVLGSPERVVCPRCMTEFPYRLGACPRCGHGA